MNKRKQSKKEIEVLKNNDEEALENFLREETSRR